jgi:hypothetical protein
VPASGGNSKSCSVLGALAAAPRVCRISCGRFYAARWKAPRTLNRIHNTTCGAKANWIDSLSLVCWAFVQQARRVSTAQNLCSFFLENLMNSTRTLLVTTLLAIGAIAVAPEAARADFQLSWNQSNTVVADSPGNGNMSINASANGFTVLGGAVGSNSGAFAAGTTGMDFSTISISSNGAGTLILYLSQNGLTAPLGQGVLSETLTGQFFAGGGSVSLQSYANDTGLLYGSATGQAGTSPLISPPNNVTTGAVGLGGTTSTTFLASSPYSMTEVLTITFSGSGTATLSSDGDTTFALPAPAGLVLLASGSPALCLVYYLLRRRKAAARRSPFHMGLEG